MNIFTENLSKKAIAIKSSRFLAAKRHANLASVYSEHFNAKKKGKVINTSNMCSLQRFNNLCFMCLTSTERYTTLLYCGCC